MATGANLNPEIVTTVINDIIKQVGYHYDKANGLAPAVKALSGVKSAKSWGDLASQAAKAVRPLAQSITKDVIPHVKTRYGFYNEALTDPIVKKALPPEYVPAAAAGAGAKISAALGTTLGGAGTLAAAAGAPALLGAGAIAYNNYKHNKMINEWNNQTINDRSIFEAIKRKKEKKSSEFIGPKLETKN